MNVRSEATGGLARFAIPVLGVMALLVLVALAISSQSRPEFQEQQEQQRRQAQAEQAAERAEQAEVAEGPAEGPAEEAGDEPGDPIDEPGQSTVWTDTEDQVNRFDVTFEREGREVEVSHAPSGSLSARSVPEGSGDAGDDESDDEGEGEGEATVGVRITDDGFLTQVGVGEEQPGDYLVIPNVTGNGIVIDQVGGDRAVLVLDDENVTVRRDGVAGASARMGDSVVIHPGRGIPPHPNAESQGFVVETGTLEIWLDPAGQLVGSQAEADAIVHPGDGQVIVVESGRPEVRAAESVTEGEVALQPDLSGFDRVGADGQRVWFEADGWDGGYTASEIEADGTIRTLTPGDDGRVTLSDGATVGPISTPEPPPGLIQYGSMPWLLFWSVVGLVTICSIALALFLHLDLSSDETPTDLDHPIPAGRLSVVADDLRADPDPARAVRRAFRVAETGIGRLPRRGAAETPFEWAARIDEERPGLAEPVAAMCDLFAKVRFSPTTADRADQDRMIDLLVETHRRAEADDQVSESAVGHDPVDDGAVGVGG